MTNDDIKRCICGHQATVLVNAITWACGDCAVRRAIKDLGCGIAIISAANGTAKMMIWPRQANDSDKG